MVLLETGALDTSREIFSEDAYDGTRTRKPSFTNRLHYKPSALAIELYSSKAIAGKEFIQLVYCIIFYHFLTVIDFSSEKYSGSTETGTPGASREIFSQDADDGTRTRNPSITNQVL